MIKKCEECDKDFETDRSKSQFCCRSCSNKSRATKTIKICPTCKIEFKTRPSQITCSKSCAIQYFMTGENNSAWKGGCSAPYYKKICFSFHDKKCIVCSETNIIEAHHLDRNKKNNSPENLIPLCPTHHRYCHSKFREIIEKKIDKYLKRYRKDQL